MPNQNKYATKKLENDSFINLEVGQLWFWNLKQAFALNLQVHVPYNI